MSKISLILLYFVLYLIELIKSNSFGPKNLLFTADFRDSEEFIFSGTNDYIKLAVANDKSILGRSSYPTCFAVGCTKTTLICEQKSGKMIITFRSVNDTRQAYFKSTLVSEDMVLTVNCRESHTACCFEGPKKLNAVAMPPIKPTAVAAPPAFKPLKPVVPISSIYSQKPPLLPSPALPLPANRPSILLTPLRPSPFRPPILLTPLNYFTNMLPPPEPTKTPAPTTPLYGRNSYDDLVKEQDAPPKYYTTTPPKYYTTTPSKYYTTTTPPLITTKPPQPKTTKHDPTTTTTTTQAPTTTTTTKPKPMDSNKPIKVYIFSNICMGFLGGAGFVDCNG